MARPEPTWAKHYQHAWEERAGRDYFPLWQRVAFIAFARHKYNGHAQFKRGDLALVFAKKPDPATGEIKTPDKHEMQRAIRLAVERGWLGAESSTLCLVVPAHAVTLGPGHPNEPCPIHVRKAERRAKRRGKVGQPRTHLRQVSGGKQ